MQQGFRGDATAQQARSAQAHVLLDQRYFQTLVGRDECGRVATRSASEYR
jgi:hypothetical protein